MTPKQRLNAGLLAAAAQRDAGEFAAARALLDGLAEDADVASVGPPTALGLPRRLHAGYLKLAKAEGDAISRVGYQFHLVPPPALLARFGQFTTPERRAINAANRQAVPRMLHQIWIGALPVPTGCAAWARHAAAQGYGYRLWREADLAALGLPDNPLFTAMLAEGDYPGAVDVARYAVLAAEGGLYLDCDWYPARDDIGFHDLLPMAGLTALAEDTPRDTGIGGLLLANSLIACPPGHPVLHRLNTVLAGVRALLPDAPAWWATGPLIFTLVARGGAVSLGGSGMIAGSFPPGSPVAAVQELRRVAVSRDLGLLIAWKSW